MYNSFSLKKVLELYAAIPLILIALAGTYKFGYFSTFDALWVLPSISAYSLFYSILTTSLLFAFGSILSLIYLSVAAWVGHLYSLIFSILFVILSIFFIGIDVSITLSTKLIPLYFGVFYYSYVHSSIFGGQIDQYFASPLVLFLSMVAFGCMFGSGVNDANSAINNKTLPIVLFEQQTAYPNDQSDWRLLEVIDTRFVLINLKNKTDYGYEMKVVEYSKVDSIY
ncbi:hypothetical protein [Acinetobacter sp. SA01]|uniref:hypothetical protein n=1 Tax=Acinetobacter sp. SA01 TaxID=1862567 RepID=UPI00140B7C46|nr:hypothetical protein [Acinetobacter sp. SA01]